MRWAPDRIAVVFALVAGASLSACSPVVPSPADEPPGALAVAVVTSEPQLAPEVSEAEADAVATAVATVDPTAEPPAPPHHGVSRVPLREPTVGPAYSPDLIKAVLRRSMPGFRKCADPSSGSASRGTLAFTIEADGSVKEAAFKSGGQVVTPDAAQQCVLDGLRAMQFPPPPGRITVSYPER